MVTRRAAVHAPDDERRQARRARLNNWAAFAGFVVAPLSILVLAGTRYLELM
jgi:hypothetical protein